MMAVSSVHAAARGGGGGGGWVWRHERGGLTVTAAGLAMWCVRAYRFHNSFIACMRACMMSSSSSSSWSQYAALLVLSTLGSVLATVMFVAQMSFFARIADPAIGGTYMTLLNTLANLGSKWPSSVVLPRRLPYPALPLLRSPAPSHTEEELIAVYPIPLGGLSKLPACLPACPGAVSRRSPHAPCLVRGPLLRRESLVSY
jgi:hypothetical protein